MSYVEQRRDKARRLLKKDGVDALLITSPANVSYLTGFTGEDSWLVVGRDAAVLLSDSRFTTQIAEECPGVEAKIRRKESLGGAAEKVLRRMKARRVAFESDHLSVAQHGTLQDAFRRIELVGWTGKIEELRQRKDRGEIAAVRRAVDIAERAWRMFRAMLQPDQTEKEAADAMEAFLRRAGAKAGSFPAIVAADERAALPHAPPTDRPAMGKRMLLVDWGASETFYKSDLTRVLLSRKISAKLRDIYKVVLRAQQRAIRKIRPGVLAKDVDAEARRTIDRAGFGRFFGHGLGHGLGIQIHEGPGLSSASQTVLKTGMIVTIEPGIYLPGWGGVRIEDDVLVTSRGHEVLSTLPTDLDHMIL